MYKKTSLFTIVFIFFLKISYGNINYIDYKKIEGSEKNIKYFNFVKENIKYYDHWTPQ